MMPSLDYPPEFIERLRGMLGDDVEAFLEALEEPCDGLRANSLRLTPARLRALAPFDMEPLAFPREGFAVGKAVRPGKHPYHAAGLYYVQDPGAMAVGAMVDPQPGEKVLDLAAAPGGKATHIAALMENTGVLVANDVSRSRARDLAGNLERFGARNAIVLAESADRLAAHFGPYFDRVLVDAPCSGESMFHKSEAAVAAWSPAAVVGCARRQVELLESAAGLTREGGLLVYSTCTFSREENEDVVSEFLKLREDFEPAELLAPSAAEKTADSAYRLWPHRMPGAGHFVAGFRRVGMARPPTVAAWHPRPTREPVELFRAFQQETDLQKGVREERLMQLGSELYQLPEAAPVVDGLRVVRPGLWVGTLKRKRFEPAHSLAMVAGEGAAERGVELDSGDPRVHRYLRGHPIEHEGPNGWVTVAVDGYSLGWGKRVGSIVKNHYPKGLRWRT